MEATPSSIVYNGVNPGDYQEVKVSIVNKRSHANRMKLHSFVIDDHWTIPPNQPNKQVFQLNMPHIGLIAPGMAQTLTVGFKPIDYVFYSGNLQVVSEHHSITIPIQAYPMRKTISVPRDISFGDVSVSSTLKRVIPISCSLPLPFHFEAELVTPNPYYIIENPSGDVTAGCTGYLTVWFKAISLTTNRIEIKFVVTVLREDVYPHMTDTANEEHYSVDPLFCTVVARVVPGLASDRIIGAAAAEVNALVTDTLNTLTSTLSREQLGNTLRSVRAPSVIDAIASTVTLPSISSPKRMEYGSPGRKSRHGSGSGAVFDPGADWIRTHHKHLSRKQNNSIYEAKECIVDGVAVPARLDNTFHVNYVLTQDRPTLKIKELRKIIQDSKKHKDNSKI